uniref:Uncharacterized protein n=1 Tax=Glossina palpalis gambiensis TaxID=67801 RepID=A0A1B0BZP1_9MUSC
RVRAKFRASVKYLLNNLVQRFSHNKHILVTLKCSNIPFGILLLSSPSTDKPTNYSFLVVKSMFVDMIADSPGCYYNPCTFGLIGKIVKVLVPIYEVRLWSILICS